MVARTARPRRGGGAGRGGGLGGRWWELLLGTSLLSMCGLSAVLSALTAQAAPWNQDEDLAALGSLDSLLAFEDLQQAVQQAEESWAQGGSAKAKVATAPWQPAEPDPQLYLLTEYDRGGQGQTRVKRNRETAAAAAGGRITAPSSSRGNHNHNGLRRHVRNPPGSSGQRLSIVNPLDVLRQRLLLEIARRRKASVPQSNREMLEGIGKRSWSSSPVTITIEQQLERCLAQLSDTIKPQAQDKLTRLTLLYRAIEFGKCDLSNELADQPDQRPQEQEHSETSHLRERDHDDQEEWSARQQANNWSRNTRAATNSNLTS